MLDWPVLGRLLVAFFTVVSIPAFGATFLVNSTVDAHDLTPGDGTCATSGGVCTLRAAIEESNALGGTNTINVPAGTYTLSLGELVASNAGTTTITGTGAALTAIVDAGAASRVFNLQSGSVNIANVTIQNGSVPVVSPGSFGICTGAGVLVMGSATANISASLITANQTANGSGGGVCVNGTLNLSSSTVSGNFATDGGG